MTLRVRTTLAPSPIAGIGLFAAEDIPAGTITWAWDPALDRTHTEAELQRLDPAVRAFLDRYAYWEPSLNAYALCVDNARFMNHSDDPNTGGTYDGFPPGGADVALRDIKAGEEMTCDYRAFDRDAAAKLA